MHPPQVSIVVPAYRRRFLREAVESILAQTFADFELVVVDDGSPERLDEIAAAFDDPRLRYVRHADNLGARDLAGAWNRAFLEARAPLGVLASDDDRYRPGFLAEMVALSREFPGADLFHCRVAFIDAGGKLRGESELRDAHESPAGFLYSRCVRRLRQSAPDFMFRTPALRSCGGFVSMPRGWYSDDATWMALARRGGVAYSPEILFESRDSGENISSTFGDAAEKLLAGEMFRAWAGKYAESLVPESPEDEMLLASARRGLDTAIDAMSFWVLRHAPIRAAWRALKAVEPSCTARTAYLARIFSSAVRFRAGRMRTARRQAGLKEREPAG